VYSPFREAVLGESSNHFRVLLKEETRVWLTHTYDWLFVLFCLDAWDLATSCANSDVVSMLYILILRIVACLPINLSSNAHQRVFIV